MRHRPLLWTSARLAFSLGLMALVASQVDLSAFATTLAQAHLGWLVLAFMVALASWLPASWKWQRLLAALGAQASVRDLFSLNLAGLFYSLFLPGQVGGEIVKGVKLARRGVAGAPTTVSIGVDRLTGVMALGLLALGGMAVAPPSDDAPALALAAAGILLLSLSPLLALAVVSHAPRLSALRIHALPAWRLVGPLLGVLVALGQSFIEYRRSPRTLVDALVLAVAVQMLVVLANFCAAVALDITIPLAALTWIVAMTSILHLVPLALAGLGIREGAYVVLLSRFGVPNEQGLALALAVFGIIVAQGLTGGVLEVVSGLRPAARARAEAEAVAPPTVPLVREQ